jgi:hypothetical protein
MLLNIHNEESLRIRNKKFSSEWPFNGISAISAIKHGIPRFISISAKNRGIAENRCPYLWSPAIDASRELGRK